MLEHTRFQPVEVSVGIQRQSIHLIHRLQCTKSASEGTGCDFRMPTVNFQHI